MRPVISVCHGIFFQEMWLTAFETEANLSLGNGADAKDWCVFEDKVREYQRFLQVCLQETSRWFIDKCRTVHKINVALSSKRVQDRHSLSQPTRTTTALQLLSMSFSHQTNMSPTSSGWLWSCAYTQCIRAKPACLSISSRHTQLGAYTISKCLPVTLSQCCQ